jgi:hypothetical protein
MKRMHDNLRVTEFFIKAGFIAALVAVTLMPTTVNVHGNDVRVEQGWPMRGSWNELPLPPIPYLETMPWLDVVPREVVHSVPSVSAEIAKLL